VVSKVVVVAMKLKSVRRLMIILSVLYAFIAAEYLRTYFEAMNSAIVHIREGKNELAESDLEFARSRIRNLFVFSGFAALWLGMLYTYYKRKAALSPPPPPPPSS
jgi:hypothetical protein